MPDAPNGHTGVMAGGISIFLLFLIVVVAIVLALRFTSLGSALGLRREHNNARRGGRSRPTHAVVHDDGSSHAEPR
jgi:hypothetical protein